jgi:hypothetical protein
MPCSCAIQLAGFILQLVSTAYHWRWDWSTIEILSWWSLGSLAAIHKYRKQLLLEFTESTSNPWSMGRSSENWNLACCKGKDSSTCIFFSGTINCERHVQVILRQFFQELTEEETLWLASARLIYCPHCRYVYAGFVRYLRGQKYQHWYLAGTFTWP